MLRLSLYLNSLKRPSLALNFFAVGIILILFVINSTALKAQEVTSKDLILNRSCLGLHQRVALFPGKEAIFLRSYDSNSSGSFPQTLSDPALAHVAFLYDNSLAMIALLACHYPDDAVRLGLALAQIIPDDIHSPTLYNAYREGPQTKVALPYGWWDSSQNKWVEDAYQVGIATGNLAWAGIALLILHNETHNPLFKEAAQRLSQWISYHIPIKQQGYQGGWIGRKTDYHPLTWQSTEHHADLYAFYKALPDLKNQEFVFNFLKLTWDKTEQHFRLGYKPDGQTLNTQMSGLDSQTFPLLLNPDRSPWNHAIDWIENHHKVGDGFDFNDDKDGVWLEGTAQMALVYHLLQQSDKEALALDLIAKNMDPSGFIFASTVPKLTTGLALTPDSNHADFFYYRWPHLGATSWAILAATGLNPFAPSWRH
jgi:hypothetical protein